MEEEVRAHMAGYNIMARDIVAKNNPDSKFNSFKVSVNVVDAQKLILMCGPLECA